MIVEQRARCFPLSCSDANEDTEPRASTNENPLNLFRACAPSIMPIETSPMSPKSANPRLPLKILPTAELNALGSSACRLAFGVRESFRPGGSKHAEARATAAAALSQKVDGAAGAQLPLPRSSLENSPLPDLSWSMEDDRNCAEDPSRLIEKKQRSLLLERPAPPRPLALDSVASPGLTDLRKILTDGPSTPDSPTSVTSPLTQCARSSFSLPLRRSLLHPRKVCRTQSMFASPSELIARPDAVVDESCGLLGRLDCEIDTYNVRQDGFRRIREETLCCLLDGTYKHLFDKVIVIDCRFEYEYEGGHIAGAVNISSKPKLERELLDKVLEVKGSSDASVLLVFHCEYSAYRGPMMASHLRSCDRRLNLARYPKLYYPDIVILEGGYSSFYKQNTSRCHPRNYVGMNDIKHVQACEQGLDRFRCDMRARKNASFTLGERGNPAKCHLPLRTIR